ncbi:hypothetical protein HPB49_005420 [Dermacentor silvarum]|uniref:Uncharacterized protein n=1 Tax=Dermacentor silvarum TaxID=543639 RepID=A0ACB8CVJ3_DERSI|nr:hypothetical protein HPB49_005420 [Dermacentor silvarum]
MTVDAGVSCPYRLHDLVWAKLEGYPYWPAMVSAPPGEGAFVKKHATQPSVHVQFFDSSPSRAWVKLRLTKPFTGVGDPAAHSSDPRWTRGVSEAEKALALDPGDRVALLPVTDGSAAGNSTDEEDEQPSPKRRRLISDSSSEDEFQPGKNEDGSDSDSASSGVDENTISDLEPESPEKSPPSKRPASKSPAVRKLASPKAKPAAMVVATSGTWAHLSYDFLKEGKRRDAAGRLATHPDFNPHTLHVPESVKEKLTPTADAAAASTALILSVCGVHLSDFAERVKPPRLTIAAVVHIPACCLGPSLFAARCSSTWQPRGGRPTIILPRGCVGARFIVPARAPLRESPDRLFPGGHCGAHLEGKPSSAPVIVNHCDGCHMWRPPHRTVLPINVDSDISCRSLPSHLPGYFVNAVVPAISPP